MQPPEAPPRATRLRELLAAFGKLGLTAFGGPAVHIAMFEREFVWRRQWLSREHFLDLLAVTNLLPGPNSTEMAIHIGYLRAGLPGALAAGGGFIAPSFFMVWALSWFYVTYGQMPQVEPVLRGLAPVVVAVIAEAGFRFGQGIVRGARPGALLLLALCGALLGVHELAVLLAAGVAGVLLSAAARARMAAWRPRLPLWLAFVGVAPDPARLVELTWFFLRTGSVLFGSGYLLISFIERDLVYTYGWLTPQQLLDAIAMGQLTPGPLSTTATFVGYIVAGDAGAIMATVAMFVPAFIVVVLSHPFVARLRDAVVARAFLDGVNPAVVGLLAATVVRLGREALVDAVSVVVFVAAFALLARWKVNSVWLMAAGAAVGLVRSGFT